MSQVQILRVEPGEGDQRFDRWFRRRFPHVPQGRIEIEIGAGQATLAQCQQAHRARVEQLATRFRLPLFALSCNRDINAQIAQVLKF